MATCGSWRTSRCCVSATYFQQHRCRSSFQLNRVLILQKLSRMDMERLRNPDLSEGQLKKAILKRGTDYAALIKHHDINRHFQDKALSEFQKLCIKTDVVNRFTFSEDSLKTCDAVVTLGGDGTFLLAANKIPNNRMPLIGFNSDPCRSEGHLCLPKQYSSNIASAISLLQAGKFSWLFRSRIKVTMRGGNIFDHPMELHHQALGSKFNPFSEDRRKLSYEKPNELQERVLPILALNEVFLGENVSAKVSYFEVTVNDSDDVTRVKSSGILVCTGTGSTSWNLSTNRLNDQDVNELLRIYSDTSGTTFDPTLVPLVCQKFNDRFIFPPEDSKLGYTIRDLIYAGVWPKPKGRLLARTFVNKMKIKSRCSEAGLVIDGGIVYPFNDGTIATLQTDPNLSLKTVLLHNE